MTETKTTEISITIGDKKIKVQVDEKAIQYYEEYCNDYQRSIHSDILMHILVTGTTYKAVRIKPRPDDIPHFVGGVINPD